MTSPLSLAALRRELVALNDPPKAAFLQGFFKTAPGQYGHGDRFRGITVPVLRGLARRYRTLPFDDAAALLESEWHEDRLLALFLMMQLYERGAPPLRARIHKRYLARIATQVNNWDLVDASAAHLVGRHLAEYAEDTSRLDTLARDRNLWRRRVAIVATHHFIRKGSFGETLRIAEVLLDDREDLIHKATGWMLREMGKKDVAPLRAFLDRHAATMPRTMLRYALERFPEATRKEYMRRKLTAP
ncbi:MAG TPA: DNA alkylation repair protein [Fibrobacteria bacterium]|nr:DNA alkylation repair protein [Fibrobacteria bacterium]